MNEETPTRMAVPAKRPEPASLVDHDVVVAFADETEYHRFVVRRGAYAGESRYPASFVWSGGGPSDLTKNDERGLRRETLANRSIWIRNPNAFAAKGSFVCAVKGVKDRGGLLFSEIYDSELQVRAQRLHEAFLALGLKKWRIEVVEEDAHSAETERKGKGEATVDAKIVQAKASSSAERKLVERFTKTLSQTLDVAFNESAGSQIDLAAAQAKIKKLGLDKDPVVSAVLTARKRGKAVASIRQDLDFSFSGEIEKKFDLAFHVAAKILFFGARADGEYHSFQNAVKTVKNTVKIYVED